MATSALGTAQQPDNYGIGEKAAAIGGVTNTSGSSSGSSSSNQVGSSTSTTSGNTSTTGNTSSHSVTKNLSDQELAQLDALISQLLGGGTAEIRNQQAARNQEANNVASQRDQYSKAAAFSDAQGLISLTMRRSLESMLPSINRAAEDAGSSGGALRALLLQDAAQKAAESSSAAGLSAASSYGQISASLSSVLERLREVNPQATTALINALSVAKGAVSTTDAKGTSSSNSTTNSTTINDTSNQTNNTSNANNVESKVYNPNIGTGANGGAVVTNAAANGKSTTPIYFGPSDPNANAGPPIGSTLDTLLQLANGGGGNAWSGYQF